MKHFSIIFIALILASTFQIANGQTLYDDDPNWSSDDTLFTTTIAAGDMDRNGYEDLVTGNYSYPYPTGNLTSNNVGDLDTDDMWGKIFVYWQDSNGMDTTPDTIWSGNVGVEKIVLVDLDHDNDLDIVVGTVVLQGNDGQDFILKNNGDSTFYPSSSWWQPPSQDTHDLAVGDIDNDGDIDLVSVGVYGSVLLWLNTGEQQAQYSGYDFGITKPIYTFCPIDFDSSGQYPGLTVELADMDDDFDLDLIINKGGVPTVFFNEGSPDFFSSSSTTSIEFNDDELGKDMPSCMAIGKYKYDGSWYNCLAAGTMRHISPSQEGQHEYRGDNLYYVTETTLEEIYRTVPGEHERFMLVTDIAMGDLNDDGVPDLVTGAYPTLNNDGSSWIDGKAKYYLLDSTNTSFVDESEDWSSLNSDLTTSIVLGQFDDDDVISTSQSFTDSTSLQYLHLPPIARIDSVVDVDGNTIDDDDWCADLRTGWVSINPDAFDTTIIVYYSRYDSLDLALGNDGYNRIYYCRDFTANTSVNPSPTTYDLPTFDRDTTGNITSSQMDTDGAVGLTIMDIFPETLDSVLAICLDVDVMTYWYFWSNFENIRGHYFWDKIDHMMDKLLEKDINVIAFTGGAPSQEWLFPQDTTGRPGICGRPRNEKFSAYMARNLVNRYRPDGVLANNGETNNFSSTVGIMNYLFENEPNASKSPYKTDEGISSLKNKLEYNYGVIKNIDSDFNVLSPNFVGKARAGTYIPHLDTTYMNSLNTNGSYLKKYTDIIAHQYHVVVADTSTGTNTCEDPAINQMLENMLAEMERFCNSSGDSAKPVASVEWYYTWDDNTSFDEEANWNTTHNAEFFTAKRNVWSTLAMFQEGGYDVNFMQPCETALKALNQQAKVLDGCRFDTLLTYTQITGNDTVIVDDYIFENPGGTSTYVHQLRTETSFNKDILRISTVEDDSSTMDGYQATIAGLMGDEWNREYGVYDTDSVYIKFMPAEIDTTPFWVKEVYDNTTSNVSVACGLVSGKWRLISFNIQPSNNQIAVIFDGVGQDSILNYKGWLWTDIVNPQLSEWTTDQGFLVHLPDYVNSSQVVVSEDTLFGETATINIDPTDGDTTYNNINYNYNRFYISYLPQVSMPVDSAFKALLDSNDIFWIRNSAGKFYIPGYQFSKRFLCHPGEGYDLNMSDTANVDFQYNVTAFTPDSWGGGKGEEPEAGIESFSTSYFQFRDYTQDVYPIVIDTIVITGGVETGDEIAVFTSDDICCGAEILTFNQPGLILTAWADDIATEEKDGFEWGESMCFKYYDASEDTVYEIGESFTIESVSPPDEPIVAATTGGFGAGQYAVRSLHFTTGNLNIPDHYALHQNYPNPFNPATVIRYDLPYQSQVKLEIYNIIGQRVAILYDGIQSAGYKNSIWNGDAISSGVYIYRIEASAVDGSDKFTSIKKMVMIK